MMNILKELLAVLGGTALVLGIAFTGMSLFKGSAWIDSHSTLILTNGLYLYVIPIVIWLVHRNTESTSFVSPKVRSVIDAETLLVNRCKWLGQRTVVAIYKIDNDFERLLGEGTVLNIQENGYIQLKVSFFGEKELEAEDVSNMIDKLKIKPGVGV